jgi:Methyltransferase domain
MDDGYFGEEIAATYDAGVGDEGVAETVDLLAGLGGSALEFAIGTGRIALPLAGRGVRVVGIDRSRAMVARLRAKPGADRIDVTIGDFSSTRVGGRFLIETMQPDLRRLPPGQNLVPFQDGPPEWAFDRYDVATQQMSSNYLSRESFRSIPFRYVWPAELDLMAELAGLVPEDRWESWSRAPFTHESTKHISIWRKPG